MAGIGASSAQSLRRSTAVLGLLFRLLAGGSSNKLATVLYDYVPPREVDADDHLTLKAGDVVAITHEHGNGWWTGSLRGVVGRFPNNYVVKQRFGDGGGGSVLTGGGSDTDHPSGSDDTASPHPHSQCHDVDAGHDGADKTPCAARGSEVGRPPLIDAGVPVPAYASAPRSNTFQTTVIEDFFGTDPVARLVLLAELRASLHLFSEARQPGLFTRNCSEMSAPLLGEVAPRLYHALVGPEALAMIERRTGLSLAPFPSTDELAIRANLYSAVGDGIGPHMDGNPLVGRRIAGIYMLSDDGHRNLHMENEPVYAPEGALVLFEGDRLRHTVPPRSTPGMRLVVNMVWCERPCKPRKLTKRWPGTIP